MTQEEKTGNRDLRFNQWIRQNLPDSETGFEASDVDMILFNYKTKRMAILEIKTHGADMKFWQKDFLNNLSRWIKTGMLAEQDGWKFYGYFFIQFEHTYFDDGKAFLNGKEVTEEELIQKLSLEYDNEISPEELKSAFDKLMEEQK
jgi:hypothetical protein